MYYDYKGKIMRPRVIIRKFDDGEYRIVNEDNKMLFAKSSKDKIEMIKFAERLQYMVSLVDENITQKCK